MRRLARFNLTEERLAGSEGKAKYFEGTPIPNGVVLVAGRSACMGGLERSRGRESSRRDVDLRLELAPAGAAVPQENQRRPPLDTEGASELGPLASAILKWRTPG